MSVYRENAIAMHGYLQTYEEIEQARDSLPVDSDVWVQYDKMMTNYMLMWAIRYTSLLLYPKWMWK